MSRFINCYAEYHSAKCHYAECRYAEYHYAKCHYAECRYAECRYAEFRGALQTTRVMDVRTTNLVVEIMFLVKRMKNGNGKKNLQMAPRHSVE
jgi:hypothetical protein